MGIQSTKYISRAAAVERINKVCALIYAKDYRRLEEISFESEEKHPIFKFVNHGHLHPYLEDTYKIERWTNKMLETIMCLPYFRETQFDNYIVTDSGENEDD